MPISHSVCEEIFNDLLGRKVNSDPDAPFHKQSAQCRANAKKVLSGSELPLVSSRTVNEAERIILRNGRVSRSALYNSNISEKPSDISTISIDHSRDDVVTVKALVNLDRKKANFIFDQATKEKIIQDGRVYRTVEYIDADGRLRRRLITNDRKVFGKLTGHSLNPTNVLVSDAIDYAQQRAAHLSTSRECALDAKLVDNPILIELMNNKEFRETLWKTLNEPNKDTKDGSELRYLMEHEPNKRDKINELALREAMAEYIKENTELSLLQVQPDHVVTTKFIDPSNYGLKNVQRRQVPLYSDMEKEEEQNKEKKNKTSKIFAGLKDKAADAVLDRLSDVIRGDKESEAISDKQVIDFTNNLRGAGSEGRVAMAMTLCQLKRQGIDTRMLSLAKIEQNAASTYNQLYYSKMHKVPFVMQQMEKINDNAKVGHYEEKVKEQLEHAHAMLMAKEREEEEGSSGSTASHDRLSDKWQGRIAGKKSTIPPMPIADIDVQAIDDEILTREIPQTSDEITNIVSEADNVVDYTTKVSSGDVNHNPATYGRKAARMQEAAERDQEILGDERMFDLDALPKDAKLQGEFGPKPKNSVLHYVNKLPVTGVGEIVFKDVRLEITLDKNNPANNDWKITMHHSYMSSPPSKHKQARQIMKRRNDMHKALARELPDALKDPNLTNEQKKKLKYLLDQINDGSKTVLFRVTEEKKDGVPTGKVAILFDQEIMAALPDKLRSFVLKEVLSSVNCPANPGPLASITKMFDKKKNNDPDWFARADKQIRETLKASTTETIHEVALIETVPVCKSFARDPVTGLPVVDLTNLASGKSYADIVREEIKKTDLFKQIMSFQPEPKNEKEKEKIETYAVSEWMRRSEIGVESYNPHFTAFRSWIYVGIDSNFKNKNGVVTEQAIQDLYFLTAHNHYRSENQDKEFKPLQAFDRSNATLPQDNSLGYLGIINEHNIALLRNDSLKEGEQPIADSDITSEAVAKVRSGAICDILDMNPESKKMLDLARECKQHEEARKAFAAKAVLEAGIVDSVQEAVGVSNALKLGAHEKADNYAKYIVARAANDMQKDLGLPALQQKLSAVPESERIKCFVNQLVEHAASREGGYDMSALKMLVINGQINENRLKDPAVAACGEIANHMAQGKGFKVPDGDSKPTIPSHSSDFLKKHYEQHGASKNGFTDRLRNDNSNTGGIMSPPVGG